MTADAPSAETLSPWNELAPGIYVLPTAGFRMNVGLVVGTLKALVVDTGEGPRSAAEVYAHVRDITDLPLVVVNTHAHADHFFGNDHFRSQGVEDIWATSRCSAAQGETGEEQRALVGGVEPGMAGNDGADTAVLPANRLVEGAPVDLDLGDVHATLFHLGRGHTDHDLLVGAGNVLFAGDLVEEGADPAFEDSFPVDWVRTLGKMIALEDLYDVVVPGHGAPVGMPEVTTQMNKMRSAIRVTRMAMDEASVDMTKAIPILPYGPEQSRALLIRLRTLAHWTWLTRKH